MRKVSFALALMAVLGLGSLLTERVSAQNSNSNPTMENNMGSRHSRRWYRKHRKHRRHRRHRMHKEGNENANH